MKRPAKVPSLVAMENIFTVNNDARVEWIWITQGSLRTCATTMNRSSLFQLLRRYAVDFRHTP